MLWSREDSWSDNGKQKIFFLKFFMALFCRVALALVKAKDLATETLAAGVDQTPLCSEMECVMK